MGRGLGGAVAVAVGVEAVALPALLPACLGWVGGSLGVEIDHWGDLRDRRRRCRTWVGRAGLGRGSWLAAILAVYQDEIG